MMSTVVILAVLAFAWWWWEDRPALFFREGAQTAALRAYIEAAKRKECATVADAVTRRSRELIDVRRSGMRSIVEQSLCKYSPAPADLADFETDRIRLEDVSGSVARVSASYTYERLFGFFGRGRARHTYTMVLEDGRWLVDLSEHLDAQSRPNQDRRAMFLVHQAWVAVTDHRRATGEVTSDPDVIRRELPGFEFPEIRAGVAGASSPVETLFITKGPSVACVSLRSATGTLVMVKIPRAAGTGTYQSGVIPAGCDDGPLSRPYHGTSSRLQY